MFLFNSLRSRLRTNICLSDVINEHSEITVTVYDRANQESFLGMVRVSPTLKQEGKVADDWFALQPRSDQETTPVSGDIKLQIIYEKTSKKHYGPTDFQVLRLIGKGIYLLSIEPNTTKCMLTSL